MRGYGKLSHAAPGSLEGGSTQVTVSKRRIYEFIKPLLWPANHPDVKGATLGAFLCLATSRVTQLLAPQYLKLAVDAISPEGVMTMKNLDVDAATPFVLSYFACTLASSLFGQLKTAIFGYSSVYALRTARVELFQHLHSLSHDFHLSRQTGAVLRTVERGGGAVSNLVNFLILSIVPTVLQLFIIVIIFFAHFEAVSAVVTLSMLALYFWFTVKMTNWRTGLRREMNDSDNNVSFRATDSLLNFETVKFCTAEKFEVSRMDKALELYNKMSLRVTATLAALNFGQESLIAVGRLILLILMGRKVLAGEFTAGDFVMLSAYITQIAMPLNFLGSTWRMMSNAKVDLEKCIALLDEKPAVTDDPSAGLMGAEKGVIEFDNVRFQYNPDREILHGISFTVPAGNKVAIVGATGAGKSTITRLLLRCWDVSSGSIRIDGQDIRDVTLKSLRDAIAVVPQDVVMFNDTIRYNIAYGAMGLNRQCSQEDVEEAAKVAQIHDFILTLPQGYDTVVGERGLKLSGGERQRVGVARAVARKPVIMVADESTASLDTATEREIQTALDLVSKNITTVVIAHRLSTIVDADEIIVMSAGKIVERGRHSALVREAGLYASMWEAQQREEDEPDPIATGIAAGETSSEGSASGSEHSAGGNTTPPAAATQGDLLDL